ncbi:MAG: hypothetical protein DMG78_14835 [Acidobacteria bacterium]|nr:MAG: hypothetical protein DMG78_14835 [Acidobacteriota bacterium]
MSKETPSYDVELWHTLEFTDVENVCLKKWLELALGIFHPHLAVQVLAAGLMLEHYTSLLPSDPEKRTGAQTALQQKLLADFNHFLGKAEHKPFSLRKPGDMTPVQEEPKE